MRYLVVILLTLLLSGSTVVFGQGTGTRTGTGMGPDRPVISAPSSAALLESGDNLLLESGDRLMLEN